MRPTRASHSYGEMLGSNSGMEVQRSSGGLASSSCSVPGRYCSHPHATPGAAMTCDDVPLWFPAILAGMSLCLMMTVRGLGILIVVPITSWLSKESPGTLAPISVGGVAGSIDFPEIKRSWMDRQMIMERPIDISCYRS